MDPIRIGTVEYLNTSPLVRGLRKVEGVEITRAVPSRIIDLLLNDRVDIGLTSLIDIARSSEPLAILPVGMIGCEGPTMTVRVFSGVPIDRITTLHADADSHTSVVLARVLLKELHGIEPEVIEYDARERAPGAGDDAAAAWPESLLLIGDKVVADCPPAVRYPHSLDLGEAWHRLTGLPFVYAAWACRADRAGSEAVRAAAALLDRTRRRNAMRLDQIVNDEAPAHDWPVDLARLYLGRLLRFDFDERAEAAVGAFLERARNVGVEIAGVPQIVRNTGFVATPG